MKILYREWFVVTAFMRTTMGIGPIIETLTGAPIVRPVAELVPLMTIKG